MKRQYYDNINGEEILVNEVSTHTPGNLVGKQLSSVFRDCINVENIIATGGYGIVYKCYSRSECALKRCIVNTREKLIRFVQEIQVLKKFQNDHILRLLDSAVLRVNDDIYDLYILTEYCDDNLSQQMTRKLQSHATFPESEVVRIVTQILLALRFLHHSDSKPVVHRDVKVENILVKGRNNYVICDFGSVTRNEVRPCDISRVDLQDEINSFTTPAYRAPEMVDLYMDGGRALIGRKVDIWALGVLWYHICFFRLPFGESCLAINSGVFFVPDNHEYSCGILRLMNHALAYDPSLRPDSNRLLSLLNEFSQSSAMDISTSSQQSLPLPIAESEAKKCDGSLRHKSANAPSRPRLPMPVTTSIVPRERRKPQGPINQYQLSGSINHLNSCDLGIMKRSPSESSLPQHQQKHDPSWHVPSRGMENQLSTKKAQPQQQQQSQKDDSPTLLLMTEELNTPRQSDPWASPVTEQQPQSFICNGFQSTPHINIQSVGRGQVAPVTVNRYQSPSQLPHSASNMWMVGPTTRIAVASSNGSTLFSGGGSMVPATAIPAHFMGHQGHRRMVSDPQPRLLTYGYVPPAGLVTRVPSHTSSPMTSSNPRILQPQKLAIPVKKEFRISDFDPLQSM